MKRFQGTYLKGLNTHKTLSLFQNLLFLAPSTHDSQVRHVMQIPNSMVEY